MISSLSTMCLAPYLDAATVIEQVTAGMETEVRGPRFGDATFRRYLNIFVIFLYQDMLCC